MNALTTEAGLRVGPIVVETLVRHYFQRLKQNLTGPSDNPAVKLRQEEHLYDQAFTIIKAFLNAASYHTVEEVQAFANVRTPSPPWVHVHRCIVPMSCADDAAQLLITALGGENAARRIVGGCKWWQARIVRGIDAQWITAKKDWREAKQRQKQKMPEATGETPADGVDPANDSAPYEKHMDDMRCILYSHGGGYYFGSVDQERYSIQRHARKINGRVFAINYRLAPQYPFPCAIQDLLAAYLYLIHPPPQAAHQPVKPEHIVVAGDSAGGGLTLALLQVLRDTGLPLPAGGVLVSPWCDLAHSFPSIYTNTDTDIIPEYGLSFQKPSSLWPPPPEDMSKRVHASLRTWIRNTFHHSSEPDPVTPMSIPSSSSGTPTVPAALFSAAPSEGSATAPLPVDSERVSLTTASGEVLTIDHQVHLYTKNSLIGHPLVSGALSYLGGLPPLLIIASDREVLRDEVVYTAHRAANPEKYPIRDETRALYPVLNGIEKRFGPTKVHLQVYDDTAHVLPVLFSFTNPGKFCFRAIASFCREVTGMPHRNTTGSSTPVVPAFDLNPPSPPPPPSSAPVDGSSGIRRARSMLTSRRLSSFRSSTLPPVSAVTESPESASFDTPTASDSAPPSSMTNSRQRRSSISYFSRFSPSRKSTGLTSPLSSEPSELGNVPFTASPLPLLESERAAGNPAVYATAEWKEGGMVRERVSTRGIIRALEPEADLSAFSIPPEKVGVVCEPVVRRYMEGTKRWDRKFAAARKTVEKHRQRNLERARKDGVKNMSLLHNFIGRDAAAQGDENGDASGTAVKDGLLAMSGSWSWAWALDANENPPPSSIVSRRDTQEALRLARIADEPIFQTEDQPMSANNLWSVMVNFLTATPDKGKEKEKDGAADAEKGLNSSLGVPGSSLPRRKSSFMRLFPSKDKATET
ncbi:Abhydrolase-3 domain-containing protein [Mycena kentingensis (nom. inval.)]|nr:Abhydrolase-3 domain-containing protein [Mycena kentingensis (nom. inval.)]